MAFTVVLVNRGVASTVEIEINRADATVADLARAFGLTAVNSGTTMAIDSTVHDPRTLLAETSLLNGSTVAFVSESDQPHVPSGLDATAPEATATHDIVIVAGPHTGWTRVLRQGPNVLGRSADVELWIDDRSLSGRHARFNVVDGAVHVTDLGSTNGVRVGGEVVASAPVGDGDVVWAGANLFQVRPRRHDAAFMGRAPRRLDDGTVAFNRPPREFVTGPPDAIAVPPAPDEPAAGHQVFSIAAVVGPLLMAGVMVAVMGDPRFALFALLSPVAAVLGWVESKARARRQARRIADDRARRRGQLADSVESWAIDERTHRWRSSVDVAELSRRVSAPSTRLWERRQHHDDVMVATIGVAAVETDVPVDSERGVAVDDDVAELLDATLVDVPVEIDLAGHTTVGISGNLDIARGLARALVTSLACAVGPSELAVVVACDGPALPHWSWARWLPHVRDERDELGSPWVVDGVRAERALSQRVDSPESRANRLLVVDGQSLLSGRANSARALWTDLENGWSGVVVADRLDQLPSHCDVVIDVDDDGSATARWPAHGRAIGGVRVADLAVERSLRTARRLARFDDPDTLESSASLPAEVSLLASTGLANVTGDLLCTRWRESPGTPRVHLGESADGSTLFDLVADGPHVLIAGTTGSGKSEMLRSMVASIALDARPDDVNLILIDYKGGAAFDAARDLPHTVGLVTDLDDQLARRALVCLESELHHRERVLRNHDADDITALDRGVLPRLVVMIDEFATLAAELPDFLESLVGVAQRGRSLGVHLVLATQRPAGAVNDNIRANTNLRIALRVQDGGDSVDVIGVAAAAQLPRSRPGRAVVRSGADEITVIQTARVTGAHDRRPREPVELAGAGSSVGEDPPSELAVLVDACRAAASATGSWPTRRPWPEPLPTSLRWDGLSSHAVVDAQALPLALADEPVQQRQAVVGWNHTLGNLVAVGRLGSGPAHAVGLVGAGLAQRDPANVHVYAIDMLGGSFAHLRGLDHVASIAGPGDEELQRRIIDRLHGELVARQRGEVGAAASVVLLVDHLGALVGSLDGDIGSMDRADRLLRVLSDGPLVGVNAVAGLDRVGAVPAAWMAAMAQRWLFDAVDERDLHAFDLRHDERTASVFGRGLTSDGVEFQLVDLPDRLVAAAGPGGPRPIGTLPEVVSPASIPAPRLGERPWRLVVGIGDDDLEPAHVELFPGDHLLIAGAPRSGVSSCLAALVELVAKTAEVLVVTGARSPLASTTRARVKVVGDLADVATACANLPSIVIVDDAHLVDDVVGDASWATAGVLRGLIERDDTLVIAGGRADRLRSAFSHWTNALRSSRTGMVLRPDTDLDGDLFGVRLPRIDVSPVPARGVLCDLDGVRIIQAVSASIPD